MCARTCRCWWTRCSLRAPAVAGHAAPAVGELLGPVVDAMAAFAAVVCRNRGAMNLHQFRFVQEAVRRNLNLTETAKALFTSQPGISKAILELEEELGVDIFARHGKRMRGSPSPDRRC
jgi:hypothetical protein